jgi:multidrug efflux system outer membrane protein
MKVLSVIMTALILFPLAGCVLGPNYKPLSKTMPSEWNQPLSAEMKSDPNLPVCWWEILDDPILNQFIEQTRTKNPTLEAALWKIQEARATKDYVLGQYSPSIDAVGSYRRNRDSDYGQMKPAAGSSNKPYDMYSAGFDASWELYLFGQFQRAEEFAQASLEAEFENYHDSLISLYAETASNYVGLRTTQTRLQYARANIELQRQTLQLAQSRFKAGLVPELDVEQAKLNLSNTESGIPLLLSSQQAAINRLCVLTALNPGELSGKLSEFKPIPQPQNTIEIILPAQLLRQRPDIRRAERQLAAQTARIGVATGDLYPSFSLNGSIALEAQDFSNLTKSGGDKYSFGPGIRWAVFDGNRIKSNIRIQETKTKQLYYYYEQTVLTAQEEVENAVTDYIHEKQRNAILEQSVQAARKSADMAQSLYRSGLTDFQNVLDMQRALSVQQDNLAASQGQVTQNLIRVYKALGGGWDKNLPQPAGDPNSPVQSYTPISVSK